jgi:hypothetical protein
MDEPDLDNAMERLAQRLIDGDDYDPFEAWDGEDE